MVKSENWEAVELEMGLVEHVEARKPFDNRGNYNLA